MGPICVIVGWVIGFFTGAKIAIGYVGKVLSAQEGRRKAS